MTREIKLRAWNKVENRFIEIENIDYINKTIKSNSPHIYSFIDIELLQFTGFKDKNGKEIFDGDIIKSLNHLWIVEYSEERGMFILSSFKGFGYINFMDFDETEDEVIGNIYVSPELLEVVKR